MFITCWIRPDRAYCTLLQACRHASRSWVTKLMYARCGIRTADQLIDLSKHAQPPNRSVRRRVREVFAGRYRGRWAGRAMQARCLSPHLRPVGASPRFLFRAVRKQSTVPWRSAAWTCGRYYSPSSTTCSLNFATGTLTFCCCVKLGMMPTLSQSDYEAVLQQQKYSQWCLILDLFLDLSNIYCSHGGHGLCISTATVLVQCVPFRPKLIPHHGFSVTSYAPKFGEPRLCCLWHGKTYIVT